MTHYFVHQLYNFNIPAFVLICLFVILLGKANMKKELQKMHLNTLEETEKMIKELSSMEQDIKYIIGRLEK